MVILQRTPVYKKRPIHSIQTVPTPLNSRILHHQRSLSIVRFVETNHQGSIMGFLRVKDARVFSNGASEETLPTLVDRFVTALSMYKVEISVSIVV